MFKKIGIIGLGYVGGALEHWFRKNKKNYKLFLYDKFKKIGSIDEVNKADLIFVAVPTPFHGGKKGHDDSAVWESLKNIQSGKVVVIKSTVLPGTSDLAAKKFPQKTILFNPEFLIAKNSVRDFLNPERQIVGYTNQKSRKVASRVMAILPKATHNRILKAREAEVVKYFGNTFLATRVIFANQIYDFCKKIGGVDYDVIKECVAKDNRIGGSHFDVFRDGYRGYGGACLPKDTKAFLAFAKKSGFKFDLLAKVDEINEKLRKGKK